MKILNDSELLELFTNNKINSIKDLLLNMKWVAFDTTYPDKNLQRVSIQNWFRAIFNIEEKESEIILEYLIKTNYLTSTSYGNIHPIKR